MLIRICKRCTSMVEIFTCINTILSFLMLFLLANILYLSSDPLYLIGSSHPFWNPTWAPLLSYLLLAGSSETQTSQLQISCLDMCKGERLAFEAFWISNEDQNRKEWPKILLKWSKTCSGGGMQNQNRKEWPKLLLKWSKHVQVAGCKT